MPTLEQSDTVVALALMHFQGKMYSGLEEPDPYECSTILTVLKWIATCFVTDPIGDGVAAALSTEQDQITFYLATHRGQPRPEDKATGAHFIQLLRETISQTDVLSATTQLIAGLAPRLYTRFSRKVDMIRKIENKTSDPVVQFNQIVDQWAADNNMEDGAFFMAESLYHGSVESENGNQRLKSVFNAIISLASADAKIGPPQDDETRKSRVFTLSVSALALVESKFFRSFDIDQHPIPLYYYTWILRLRRRLWRLADYYRGAFTFIKVAFPLFRRILGSDGIAMFQGGGSEIKIIWIGDQPGLLPNPHPDTIVIKQSPEAFLNGLFMEFGCGEKDDPLPTVLPEHKKYLENLWHEDVAIDVYLHCELQMIAYLEANCIQIQENSIGSSKPVCWACNTYVEKVNANRESEDRWVLSGTSYQLDYRWLVPQTPIGEDIASNLKARFPSSVESLHLALYVRNRGAGSDRVLRNSDIERPGLQALALLIQNLDDQ